MNQHEQMINPQHSNKIKRRSHFDKLWTENEVQHSNPDQSITLEAQRLWSSAQPEWTRWMKKHGMRTRPLRDYVAPAGWQVGRSDRAAAATGSGGTGSGECGTPVRRRRWWSSSAPPPPTGRDATRTGGWGAVVAVRAGGEGGREARTRARPHGYSRRGFPLGGAVTGWAGGWWLVVAVGGREGGGVVAFRRLCAGAPGPPPSSAARGASLSRFRQHPPPVCVCCWNSASERPSCLCSFANTLNGNRWMAIYGEGLANLQATREFWKKRANILIQVNKRAVERKRSLIYESTTS